MKKRLSRKFLLEFLIRKQSLWSLGGNGVSALGGLLLFAISSSRLHASDFGIWIIFQTVSTLLDMFRTGLLLPGYLQISAGKTRLARKKIYQSVQTLFILITLGQATLCWLLMLLSDKGSALNFFFTYYPMILLSGAMLVLAEWWYQSVLRFQNVLILRTFHRVILVASAFWYVHDLTALVYVQVVANVGALLLILAVFRITIPTGFSLMRIHRQKLLAFGKYSTPSQMLSNLLRSSDALMIGSSMGVAATGIYGAAAKFLEFIELPVRSLGAVHFNYLARRANEGNHEDAIGFARKQILSGTLKVLPIALALGIFAPQLITTLSGNQYLASIPVLRVMAIYCILIPADRYCGLLLEAFGRPDLNLLKVFVMLLSNVAGNLIAIFFFNTPLSIAASSIVTFSVGIGFGFWLIAFKALSPESKIHFNMAVKS